MEQSASAAYPNVLVADYMRKAGPASSEKVKSSRELVREGYQRILTFQNSEGGFGWWSGGGDPQVWVTAYALHFLRDCARIVEVDARPLERARGWLRRRQSPAGSWDSAGDTHGVSVGPACLTAYVTWALGGDRQAAEWLEGHVSSGDAYQAALVSLALLSSGHAAGARRAAERLSGMEWTGRQTLSYGTGACGQVEVAGLAVQALAATGVASERLGKGIDFLVKARREGDWGTTQATIQALRALTSASEGTAPGQGVRLTFRSGTVERNLELLLGDSVAPTIDLTDLLGSGAIEVETHPDLSLTIQAVLRHHEPWKVEATRGISMAVSHPEQWCVGQPARVSARLEGSGARMVIAEVGLPPGASPRAESLEQLAAEKRIARYEVRPDRVVFYLNGVEREARLDFDVVPRLKAEACVRPGRAYEFYDPDRLAIVPTSRVSIIP